MNEIKHFILPEHTNDLYKKEAISSISLTKEIADKINELVDALNNTTDIDLKWKHEIEGKVHKGVIFMKDNLLNSLHDLLELYGKDDTLKRMILDLYEDIFKSTKFYATPQMFGARGDGLTDDTEAIEKMFESGYTHFYFDGKFMMRNSVEIPDGVIVESNNATFKQLYFGDGVFVTSGSNIHFIGNFNFICDGKKRKINREGVESSALLLKDETSNIEIDSFNIYNFIGGIVFGGKKHNNININFVHVEKCDFGLWGANVHGLNVKTLSFKDIDNSQNEPAHALYLTGNDRTIKSENVHIENVIGTGCVSDKEDCVVSIKATSNFRCDNIDTSNVNCVFTSLNSSGCFKNVNANNVYNYVFMVQGYCTDGKKMTVKDCCFNNLKCVWYGYSVGAEGKALIENCTFVGTSKEGFAYISNVAEYEERNCFFDNTGNEVAIYNIASANKGVIYAPHIINAKLVNFIQSGVNFFFYIDPTKLCDKCNNVTYHTIFLDNEYFVELSDVTNNAIYNNIIANGCTIQRLRGNGVVTVINKDNTSAIMNTLNKMVLKNGATQYTAGEWDCKMFRLVNDIAYEL